MNTHAPADSVNPDTRHTVFEAVEIAASGLWGHPVVNSLADETIAAYRPAFEALDRLSREATAALHPAIQTEFTPALYGTSVMTRFVALPADIDFVLHTSIVADQAPSNEPHLRRMVADHLPAVILALSEALPESGESQRLEFVHLKVFVPLTHAGFPGQVRKYCCAFSREDVHIGTCNASLGAISLHEALLRGGEAVLTLAASFHELRTLIDVRIDPVFAPRIGNRIITPAAHRTWTGKALLSRDRADAAAALERDVMRTIPGYNPSISGLQLRDGIAAARLNEGKPLKAVKYAIQALAYGGHLERALRVAPFLRSAACRLASLGGRLSNLVAQARYPWAPKERLLAEAGRLEESVRPLVSENEPGASVSSVSRDGDALLQRLASATHGSPDDPRVWASLWSLSGELSEGASADSRTLIHEHGSTLEPLGKLLAAAHAAHKPDA